MEMNVTNKLVLGFLAIILGAVLIGTLATNSLAVTTKAVAVNEFMDYSAKMQPNGAEEVNESGPNNTITYSPNGWKQLDCPISSVVVANGSGTVLTLNTDYELDASIGDIAMLNTTATNSSNNYGNSTLVTYTYCGDDYMNLSWGRTLLNLVAGFFALSILGIGIGIFYSVGKDTGII